MEGYFWKVGSCTGSEEKRKKKPQREKGENGTERREKESEVCCGETGREKKKE